MGRAPGLPFVVMFHTVLGDTLTMHTLLSSSSFHSLASQIVCVPLEGITWVNPCNV